MARLSKIFQKKNKKFKCIEKKEIYHQQKLLVSRENIQRLIGEKIWSKHETSHLKTVNIYTFIRQELKKSNVLLLISHHLFLSEDFLSPALFLVSYMWLPAQEFP